ncbi:MAG: GIY-YIG nuclease family protein [Patescibacteria group bacterium]
MYTVYILKSRTNSRYYIGCTNNLVKRLETHNSGRNPSTRPGKPWELVCYKIFHDREEAFATERLIKSYKGGNALKKILNGDVSEWSNVPLC